MTDDAPAPRASHDTALEPALAASLGSGWAVDGPLDINTDEIAPYTAKRRAALSAAFPGEALVIPSGLPKVRANDCDYPFRTASDYAWLTGDTEPAGVLVLAPVSGGHDAVLYVPARSNRESLSFFSDRAGGELWTGRRPDPTETALRLGVECRPLAALPAALATLGITRLRRGIDATVDAAVDSTARPAGAERDAIFGETLSELRLIKDDWEVAQLRAATDATARGFADVLRERAGALEFGERWLDGTFYRRARSEGNDVGYSSIVAAGPHATTLHWMRNDGPVRDGDLLLLDMGVEMRSLYTADVTRTVPVDGCFTPDQRRLYTLVYAAQEAGMAEVRPGADFLAPNRAAMAVLAAGLHDWGILTASVDEVLNTGADAPRGGLHRRYTLHNISHMLGLDVHDCAAARRERYLDGPLAAGMVLTIEPGLYFQPDDLTVPPELRGLGVRIEDDVLVTADGVRNLSDQLPRDPDAVAAWVAGLH